MRTFYFAFQRIRNCPTGIALSRMVGTSEHNDWLFSILTRRGLQSQHKYRPAWPRGSARKIRANMIGLAKKKIGLCAFPPRPPSRLSLIASLRVANDPTKRNQVTIKIKKGEYERINVSPSLPPILCLPILLPFCSSRDRLVSLICLFSF